MTQRPRGRPLKEINQEEFEKLCKYHCTSQEIMDFFDVTDKTITAWCRRTYNQGFSDARKRFEQMGKANLRKIQFQLAEKNPNMAIFLGKQYLGQSDSPTVAVSMEGIQAANAQFLSLAEMINHPVAERTLAQVEALPEAGRAVADLLADTAQTDKAGGGT